MEETYGVLYAPQRSMERVAKNQLLIPGVIVVAIWALINLIGTIAGLDVSLAALQQSFQQEGLSDQATQSITALFRVGGPILAIITPFIYWFFTSVFIFIAGRMLSGQGSFTGSLAIFGLALAPQVCVAIIQIFLDAALGQVGSAIGSILSLIALIWTIVLAIIGISHNENFSYERSTGACAISCVESCVFWVAVGIVVTIVIAGIGVAVAGSIFTGTGWPLG